MDTEQKHTPQFSEIIEKINRRIFAYQKTEGFHTNFDFINEDLAAATESYNSLNEQNATLFKALKQSVKELKFLYNEVNRLAPGSYRAATTIRDAESALQSIEAKPKQE